MSLKYPKNSDEWIKSFRKKYGKTPTINEIKQYKAGYMKVSVGPKDLKKIKKVLGKKGFNNRAPK